jgi:tetratricopeptide (TPR) repeat protein
LPARRVKLLLDSAATLAAIQSALAWQLETATPDAPSYLYLATHGDVEAKHINTGGFLLAHDTPRNNYELLSLSVSYLNDHLRRLAAKGITAVVITDACHAGTLAGNAVSGRTLTAARLMQQLDQEVRLLSCQPYELAREGERWGDGRGAFSYHLIRGLEGGADSDRDRRVDLFELERYVAESVSEDTERQQHPALVGGRKDWVVAAVTGTGPRKLLEERTESAEADFLTAQLALTTPHVQRTYLRFQRALEAGNLITPAGKSARDYFRNLRSDPELLRVRGLLDADFTVALLDSVQQAIQDYLEADADELMQREELDSKYLAFPEFLAEAAAIVGPADPRYPGIEAKRLYFEGLIRRLQISFTSQTDSLLTAADSLLTLAMAGAPEAAYIHNELGIVKEAMGEYEAAQTAYERARELAPTWAIPYSNLGSLLTDLDLEGNAEPAAAAFRRAIALKPDLATTQMNYGTLLLDIGKRDSALIYLREGYRLGNQYALTGYNLAYALQQDAGDRAEARDLFRRVIADHPDLPDAYLELGNTFRLDGRLDSAEAVYIRAIERFADYPWRPLYDVLMELYRDHEPERGVAYFRTHARNHPHLGIAHAARASIDPTDREWLSAVEEASATAGDGFGFITSTAIHLYRYGQADAAELAAGLAVRQYPDKMMAHRNLTELQLRGGKLKQAAESVRRAVTVARANGELPAYCSFVRDSDLYTPLLEEQKLRRLLDKNCP